MEILLYFRRITRKQLIAAMMVCCLALPVFVYYDDQPETVHAPAAIAEIASARNTPAQGRMPIGFEPGKRLRDPFAVPKQFAPIQEPAAVEAALPTAVRSKPSAKRTAVAKPALTGVVGADGKWAAIIRFGDESRSYQLGEYAGSYRIVAITGDSVTVLGPEGSLLLTVGR